MHIVLFKKFENIIIDINKHPLFFQEDNEIVEGWVKFYRNKIKNDKKITGIKVVTAVYSDSEKKHILMGIEPKIGDIIYIVTNGHHRITAMLLEGITKFKTNITGYKFQYDRKKIKK